MNVDPWEPWLSELERYEAESSSGLVQSTLEELCRFPFYEHRGRDHSQWERLFASLLRLLGHPEPRVRELAGHYAEIAMYEELAPPYIDHTAEDHARSIRGRTAQLLPALEGLIRCGEMSLLRCVDDLVHIEGLAEVGPQSIVERWIDSLAGNSAGALAARIAYLAGREGPSPAPGSISETLPRYLDHDDTLVRAYAARALGARYFRSSDGGLPPLAEFVATVTAKEIERPGIAGPFLSNWYDFGLDDFEARAGVRVQDWLCTLLAERKAPEPDTLPCSNGIDFFAHEIFGGQAPFVRRLIDMGHLALALEAATEINEPVEGMEPLLVELADHGDASATGDLELCWRASRHLADHYRRLHPAGARRGFVERWSLDGLAEIFVHFEPLKADVEDDRRAFGAAAYPMGSEPFDEDQAAAALEAILPSSLRGEMVPFGLPGDGEAPGLYHLGTNASARYSGGALVQYIGLPDKSGDPGNSSTAGAKRYARLRVLWYPAPAEWHPERASARPTARPS